MKQCFTCGSMIMEQGKTYGYSGPVCQCEVGFEAKSLHEPPKSEVEPTIRELVMQAIGEASMCWQPYPTGVFDSTRAIEVGERLLAALERLSESPPGASATTEKGGTP